MFILFITFDWERCYFHLQLFPPHTDNAGSEHWSSKSKYWQRYLYNVWDESVCVGSTTLFSHAVLSFILLVHGHVTVAVWRIRLYLFLYISFCLSIGSVSVCRICLYLLLYISFCLSIGSVSVCRIRLYLLLSQAGYRLCPITFVSNIKNVFAQNVSTRAPGDTFI